MISTANKLSSHGLTLFNLGQTWSNSTLHCKLHDLIGQKFSKDIWPSLAMPLTLHVTCHWIPYEENLVVLLWCQGSESYQKGAAFLSLAFLSKRLSIQLTWETLPISEALWKTHSKNLSLSSLQRITIQRQMQKYPAEGRSCDSCAVLTSLLGWTWGLVYISRSCRPETPKCHFVLRWNLKPIITSFHNVCYYNSSVWLPCGLILLKKKKPKLFLFSVCEEKNIKQKSLM